MSLNEFDSSISDDMRSRIIGKLRQAEAEHNVRILFAIESGSRAWGFPSPDSDYDVRFVYAHPPDWYLSLTPGRDVIELPLDAVYDINGWDIKKALNLLLKPNPVLLEWLSSPIQYIWDDNLTAKLVEFSQTVAHGPACLHHYLSLGQRQFNVYIDGKERVNLKKYFYIVRPAMAIAWIRKHPNIVPPMNFQNLMAGLELNADLQNALKYLLLAKSRSKEIGQASRVSVIDDFITAEFNWAQKNASSIKVAKRNRTAQANTIFRSIIKFEQ